MTFSRILKIAAVVIGVAVAVGLPLRQWKRSQSPPINSRRKKN